MASYNTMRNKNDAWKRRKSGQMKFKARCLKGNKNTSSLINTLTIIGAENDVFTPASLDVVSSLQTASTKKLKGLLLALLLVLLLKTISDVIGRCRWEVSLVPSQRIVVLKTRSLRIKALLIFYILAVMLMTLFIQLIATNRLFLKEYLANTLSI